MCIEKYSKKYGVVATMALLLAGCATQPSTISFYDSCMQQNSSFAQMAACGKQAHDAYCTQHQDCSPDSNDFVLYTDSLARSVAEHKMTADEAQRKWIEFRAAQVNAAREQAILLQSQTIASSGYTD